MLNIIKQHKGKLFISFIGLNYIALRAGFYGKNEYNFHNTECKEYIGIRNDNFLLFNLTCHWLDYPHTYYGPFKNFSFIPIIINHYDENDNLIKTYN